MSQIIATMIGIFVISSSLMLFNESQAHRILAKENYQQDKIYQYEINEQRLIVEYSNMYHEAITLIKTMQLQVDSANEQIEDLLNQIEKDKPNNGNNILVKRLKEQISYLENTIIQQENIIKDLEKRIKDLEKKNK